MYNRHVIVGNVGTEPRILKTETSGTKFAVLRVLTTRKKKTGHGWEDITDGHNVVLWDGLADVVEKNVFKGQRVLVDGPSSTRKYTNKDGEERTITEITAREFRMLSWRDDEQQGHDQGGPEDEIPF